ncbi:MAG: SDR family NAD(P)-dependent oxidoreductase [Verrucomicrobiota bacterium]
MNTSRVILITGAVGNLGLATARAFHQAGARTVLIDRSAERLRKTFPELVDSPDHFLASGVDLGDPAAVHKMVTDTVARFARIDVLVNTVGAWGGGKPVHEEDSSLLDKLLNVNLRTTVHCCRAVIPHMLKEKGGKIVNVASRDGLLGTAGFAAYSISKSAVLRLTEALADELKDAHINVNCILPATIDTPQNRAAMPDADFRKWVEPAALADVILFLASDAARAINGAALPVYGKG